MSDKTINSDELRAGFIKLDPEFQQYMKEYDPDKAPPMELPEALKAKLDKAVEDIQKQHRLRIVMESN